jgi:hypothetical protein
MTANKTSASDRVARPSYDPASHPRPANQAEHLSKIAAAVTAPVATPTAPSVNGVTPGYNSHGRADQGPNDAGIVGQGSPFVRAVPER